MNLLEQIESVIRTSPYPYTTFYSWEFKGIVHNTDFDIHDLEEKNGIVILEGRYYKYDVYPSKIVFRGQGTFKVKVNKRELEKMTERELSTLLFKNI